MPQFLPYNTLADGDEFRDADGNVIETFNPDVTTTAPIAGQTLIYNGTKWVPGAAASGGGGAIIAIQEFTASGTYTIPADTVALRVTAAGAGGGGQGRGAVAEANSEGGNGGASGEYGTTIVTLPSTGDGTGTLTVSLGTGGTVAFQNVGQPGGDTSLTSNSITITTARWLGGGGGAQGGEFPPTSPNNYSAEGGGRQFIGSWNPGNANQNVILTGGRVNGIIAFNASNVALSGGFGGNNGKATGGDAAVGATGFGASGNTFCGGGGGGGAGWVNGADGTTGANESSGGAGGNGGMVIEALSILPT